MSSDNPIVQELKLPAVGIELSSCLWRSPDKPKFFALHGWLDNASSMEPLARQLDNLQILAPDLAGHGRSDFRSADSNYDLSKDVADIAALADKLGWDSFGLIGHSRGAMIAAIFAATFPDRISHLILIDGGSPHNFDCSERPAKLARAIREQAMFATKRGSIFSSREAALNARSKGFVPVDRDIAELLAQRALIEEEKGFRWRADQRLKAATTSPLDTGTMRAFFAAIKCPVLQIIGDKGLVIEDSDFGGPIELIEDFDRLILPGDHHLHIGQVDSVAANIQLWLAKKGL